MTATPKKRGRPLKGEKGTPEAVPQALLPGVQRVVAHRPLSVLEVQDSADLDALLLDTRLSGQIVSRLGSHFVLLLPGSEKAVLDALRKAGHLPKVVGP